ncbi:GFA family protein [Parvularcula marina]|uniref:GFA family protein n=1 Tax=Parvularcula marina TaxID=2292771 RepID=UPI003513BA71
MVKAECNCGGVAFEISAELKDIYVCHCSICRKLTGSSGIPVVIIPNKDFRWLRGEELVSNWKKPDADWQSWFCKTCGSTLPGMNDPDTMFVPAGLLGEGGETLRVAHHIWVGSKAVWDEIGDSGKQHQNGFEA